jgi:uncharacterized alpha-E superfamily protein
MLSRVAENIYWMGRYLERAEDAARLVSVNTNLLLDLPRGIAPGWEPLIVISGADQVFREQHTECTERRALRFLIGDEKNPSSILSSLHAARENCRTVRDIVPRESWEDISEVFFYAKENLQAGLTKRGRHEYLRQIVRGCQTIVGSLAGTMSHDKGFAFLRLGRFTERADMTTRIVDVRTADLLPEDAPELGPFDNIQWMSVLKSLTGYQMYRRNMQVRVRRSAVLRFLFQNVAFPRSVMHSLVQAETIAGGLGHNDSVLRVLGRLKRLVQGTDVAALSQQQLHQFVDDLQLGLIELHDELVGSYFRFDPDRQQQAQDGQQQTQAQIAI